MPAQILQPVWQQENKEELHKGLKAELDGCTEVAGYFRKEIERFMVKNHIGHTSELDYGWRVGFENYLNSKFAQSSLKQYRKAFDRVKQHAILLEAENLRPPRDVYENNVMFLPYYPDSEINKRFDNFKEVSLIWDFRKSAPENMKRQIYQVLLYIIKYDWENKSGRNYLVYLKRFYEICDEIKIIDIEKIEANQIEEIRLSKEVNVEKKMVIELLDYCRKILFLQADEIH